MPPIDCRTRAFQLRFAAGLAALVMLTGDATGVSAEPPPVQRDFRAAWIATVANIDWPSKPGLPAGQQREELVRRGSMP